MTGKEQNEILCYIAASIKNERKKLTVLMCILIANLTLTVFQIVLLLLK